MKVRTKVGMLAAIVSTSVFATATSANAAVYEVNAYNNAGVIKAKFKYDNFTNELCAKLFTTNEGAAVAKTTLYVENGGPIYSTGDDTADGQPHCWTLPSDWNGRPASIQGSFYNNKGATTYTDVIHFTY